MTTSSEKLVAHSAAATASQALGAYFLVLAQTVCLAACANDDDAAPATHPMHQPMSDILAEHHANGEFPGGVIGLEGPDGQVVSVTTGTRTADPEGLAVDSDIPWGIGSVTKMFVSVVVLQLAEEGKLDLDASIEEFLPNLPGADEITVRHLLRCESGLNDYFNSEEVANHSQRPWSAEELIEANLALGSLSEPGAEYHYSNTGYIILGEIIRHVTGTEWDEQVRERITEVLDLESTGAIGDPSLPPIGPGYGIEDGRFVNYDDHLHPSTGESAGGMQSTVDDLLVFIQALFEGALLEPETLAEMQTMVPGEDYPVDRHEYGLGLERYLLGPVDLYGHMGTGSAHSAFVAYNYAGETAVVVMLNAEPAGPQAFIAMEVVAAAVEQEQAPEN